jgi:hypothetical protein
MQKAPWRAVPKRSSRKANKPFFASLLSFPLARYGSPSAAEFCSHQRHTLRKYRIKPNPTPSKIMGTILSLNLRSRVRDSIHTNQINCIELLQARKPRWEDYL